MNEQQDTLRHLSLTAALQASPLPTAIASTALSPSISHDSESASSQPLECPPASGDTPLRIVWSNAAWTEGQHDVGREAEPRWITSPLPDGLVLIIVPAANMARQVGVSGHNPDSLPDSIETIPDIKDVREDDSPATTPQSDQEGTPEVREKPQQQVVVSVVTSGTFHQPTPGQVSCRELLDNFDWGSTPIGPRNEWSNSLKNMIDTAFSTKGHDAVFAGETPESLVLIYGEGYKTCVDHPKAFGGLVSEAWAPIWDWTAPVCQQALSGDPIYGEISLFPYMPDQSSSWIERYLCWALLPITDGGKVVGLYVPMTDETGKVFAKRRADTMRLLVECVLYARSQRELFDNAADVLEKNPHDAPFGIFYSVKQRPTVRTAGSSAESDEGEAIVDLHLESTVGVPSNHPSAPTSLTLTIQKLPQSPLVMAMERMLNETKLDASSPDAPSRNGPTSPVMATVSIKDHEKDWPIVQALTTRQCVLVDNIAGLIDGYEVRAWDELPTQALVIPLAVDGSSSTPTGVLILGLNFRRPLDATYDDWIQNVRAHLTSGLGSINAYEEEVRRRQEQAKLESAKAAWLRGAAHEFRSPLTLIMGPLEDALRLTRDPHSRMKRYLTLAHRNVHRLQRLVTSLLDYSRMEAGVFTPKLVLTDLGQFLDKLAEIFRPAFERVQLAFNVEVDTGATPIAIDPNLLETALSNLLGNALKYTHSGSVSLKLWYDDEAAYIAISDTGVGIPSSELGLVGNWFHRTQTASSSNVVGTGIGLALAERIIRLHGGDLQVTSKVLSESTDGSHGSSFTTRLPLVHDLGEHVTDSVDEIGGYGKQVANELLDWGGDEFSDRSSDCDSGAPSIGFSSSTGEGLVFDVTDHILVVDDDADIRQYIATLLQPFCKVTTARDGQEALEQARITLPDLILSDGNMPIMTGHDLLMAVRQDPILHKTPVVLLSAGTDEESRVGAIVDGAEDYLMKPFKPRELLARVHLHMQMGKKRIQLENMFVEREHRIRMMNEEKLLEAEARRMEAEESRHQQELLVDLTSHEIRSPVSAILQCSSVVKANLVALKEHLSLSAFTQTPYVPTEQLLEEMQEDVEALESIYQCGQVQDRIASDILSLARIQLDMLTIHNADIDMRYEARRGLRIFKSEARSHGIELMIQFGQSMAKVAVIRADPVRVGQVLTNLVTNGIRFTAVSNVRRIVVRYDIAFSKGGPDCRPPEHEPLATEPVPEGTKAWLYVSVTDTGPGMTQDEQDVIFERFHQGNRMTHMRFGGTGLGLFICRKITRLLGGDIQVESTAGQGSVFRFFIETTTGPAVKPGWVGDVGVISVTGPVTPGGDKWFKGSRSTTPSPNLHIQSQLPSPIVVTSPVMQQSPNMPIRPRLKKATAKPPPQHGAKSPLTPPSSTLPSLVHSAEVPLAFPSPACNSADGGEPSTREGMRILIVEDNLINQTILKRQLTKEGFTCSVASNGKIALDALGIPNNSPPKGGEFDLVLMDLEMPVMDGLTATVAIRAYEAEDPSNRRRQLIIALTGNARQGRINEALASGMDDVLLKPYHLPDLLVHITNAIEKQRDAVTTEH